MFGCSMRASARASRVHDTDVMPASRTCHGWRRPIQTDAPINQGNCSGALANTRSALVKDGRVRQGQLGVTVQGVTSDLAESLGLSEVRGALVSGVNPGSTANAAALLLLRRPGSDFFVELAPRRG